MLRKRDSPLLSPEAVRGDLRISIGNFQGEPTAVLYRKVSQEKKPMPFSSGVMKDYSMDYVDVLSDAHIEVKVRGDRHVTEAAMQRPFSAEKG